MPSRRQAALLAGILSALVAAAALAQEIGPAPAAEAPPAEVTPPGPLYCEPGGACAFPFALPDPAHVVVAPLHGEVTLGMAAYVRRVADGLEPGDVLILDVNTFGGRVDAAVQIRDALLAVPGEVVTIAHVHPRAISAGALISLATDLIVVTPGATIGAATPVTQGQGGEMEAAEEKVVSYMRTEMRSTAEAKGRSGTIAEAMVDRDAEVAGLSPAGKLLTLDGTDALAWGIASLEAASTDELLVDLGYRADGMAHTLERADWSWAEKLAGWMTGATLSGLLMTVGMLALMIGLYSGGAPLPLAIGGLCLGIFFFGHHIVNLAGFEEILLFVLGLVLVGVELVVPGTVLPGVLGVLLIVVSLFLGLIDFDRVPLDVQWELGWVTRALVTVFGAILATGVLIVVAVRTLPESAAGRWLFLDARIEGRSSDTAVAAHAALVGSRGVAATDLHPSGRVTVAGRRYDAVAEIGFIPRGTQVVVRRGRGFSIVVAPAPEAEEPEPEPEPEPSA